MSDAPYVTVGTPLRVVPAVGCRPERGPDDPRPVFGALPFSLWQPFVKVEAARPDLDDPARRDGEWEHGGWRLTRRTIGQAQVSVLAPPGRADLGDQVLDSARRVETTSLGCEVDSPVAQSRFVRPSGPPVPEADAVAAVVICEYARSRGASGLEGSRRISGESAHDLVEAIRAAPPSGGPDRPESCVPDEYGERAIALRFFDQADSSVPVAEAYVYYDSCFGNGIIDSAGERALTRRNCAPLFARPPVTFRLGEAAVFEVCGRVR